jgi:hypothetical protein
MCRWNSLGIAAFTDGPAFLFEPLALARTAAGTSAQPAAVAWFTALIHANSSPASSRNAVDRPDVAYRVTVPLIG